MWPCLAMRDSRCVCSFFFFSSRRRHTRLQGDWSSDVCSSDLPHRGALLVQEMVIYGVSFDMVGKQPIVLLKTVDSNKFLPIWIGHPEAAAILKIGRASCRERV